MKSSKARMKAEVTREAKAAERVKTSRKRKNEGKSKDLGFERKSVIYFKFNL